MSATEICGPAGFAHGYGLCVNALLDKADKRYLGFLVLPILLLLGLGAWWYIRRERRTTREASEKFRNGMDEVDVRKRVGKYRLERFLGMERARLAGDAEALGEGDGQGGKKGKKRLRELLLPSKRRAAAVKVGDAKEAEAMEMTQARGSMLNVPPPPYAPSSPSVAGSREGDAKVPLSAATMSSGHFSPTYAPTNSFSEAQYALKQQRAAKETVDQRRYLTSTSELDLPDTLRTPFISSIDAATTIQPGGLLPPPRPAVSFGGAKPKLEEDRKTLRFADEGVKRGNWMDEVDALGVGADHVLDSIPGTGQADAMRLSQLWPEMKGRKTEGWV